MSVYVARPATAAGQRAFADSFNRANGALTAPWSAPGYPTYLASISGNKVIGPGGNDSTSKYCAVDMGSSNFDMTFTCTIAGKFGLWVPISAPPASNGLVLDLQVSMTKQLQYYDGSLHAIWSEGGCTSPATVRLRKVGTAVTLYIGGVSKWSGSDAHTSGSWAWFDIRNNSTLDDLFIETKL